jgi:hypothetical protein
VAVELGEDTSDVRLGGEWADNQAPGDVSVAEAGGYELEDLAFAFGELGQLRGRCSGLCRSHRESSQVTRCAEVAGLAVTCGDLR